MATTGTDSRAEKVKRIFRKFDMNRDGYLNRVEMASLVVAVNPRVKFSDDQINTIIDEVFRTYADFINGGKGMTFDGILRSYDDGAGDVDRDFDCLGLDLITPEKSTMLFDDPWTLVNDLHYLIQKLISNRKARVGKVKSNNNSDEFLDKRFVLEESGQNYATVLKELGVLRSRVDRHNSRKEAFDGHVGIGRILYDYHLYKEALASFNRACELLPTEVIPRFRAGNCLFELGRHEEAKGEFLRAQEIAETGGVQFDYLLPQIHVNLGILLQVQGMVFNACDRYIAAVTLCPTHFRAHKLLGSALLALGEYKAAVVALEAALYLKIDYLDAHFDLASALLAIGDRGNAIEELIKVINLKPDHVDALCSLAGIYLDRGRYLRASRVYNRVLDVWPHHWKAQLCKAVSLFGAGENEEAKKYLKEALKMANRVELHDRIAYLKLIQKRWLMGNGSDIWVDVYITVEPSKFKTVEDGKTTSSSEMAKALDIWGFQKITRLNQCDVGVINKLMNENYLAESSWTEKFISKVTIEDILGKLLGFSKPQSFAAAVKAINQKIFSILDESKSGRVDYGLFLAVVAPLCQGTPERRKQASYNALSLRAGNEVSTEVKKSDAQNYIKLLRAIYIPSDGLNEMPGIDGEADNTSSSVSLKEFLPMFDDHYNGFGIMFTLLKLETDDRNRRCGGRVCATCHYQINGLRFKEMKSNFSLCSQCYSEGKVPLNCDQEDYIFKEYNAT